jgi:hypothetical protein
MRSSSKARMHVRIGLAATLAALALSAGTASAYTVHGDWIASDYVSGFTPPANADEAAPIGLAFDGSANLFITDIAAGTLHRVPPGGGTAAGTVIASGLGKPAGLAFGPDGRLYLGRADQGRIDEVSPANGSVVRKVATGIPCPTGLAIDPISADLFASNKCGGGATMRIAAPASASPKVTTYAQQRDDGLTFAPDGTLFAAADDSRVDAIAATNSPNPGSARTIANVEDADGIAYSPAQSGNDAYLVVNRTNGEIDRLDFDGTLTPIVTGAPRGDLVTVGPDHCIYAALQDRVIKLSPGSGECGFATPLQNVLGDRSSRRVVDMAIKASGPKSAKRKSRFDLKLKVSNKSKTAAHSVVVTDTLPKGIKFVKARSAKGVKCKRRGRTLTCRKSSLAARKSFTVVVRVLSVRGTGYTNSAKVKSSDLDPKPGNNKSKSKTKVRRGK